MEFETRSHPEDSSSDWRLSLSIPKLWRAGFNLSYQIQKERLIEAFVVDSDVERVFALRQLLKSKNIN